MKSKAKVRQLFLLQKLFHIYRVGNIALLILMCNSKYISLKFNNKYISLLIIYFTN